MSEPLDETLKYHHAANPADRRGECPAQYINEVLGSETLRPHMPMSWAFYDLAIEVRRLRDRIDELESSP